MALSSWSALRWNDKSLQASLGKMSDVMGYLDCTRCARLINGLE